MNLQTHFLLPAFLGMGLWKLGVVSWEWILIGGMVGVLIDVDHYVENIMHSKTQRFSLRSTWC